MMRNGLTLVLVLALAAAGGQARAACAEFTASPVNLVYDPLGAQGTSQVVEAVTLTAASDTGSPVAVSAQFVDQETGTLRIGTSGPVYRIRKSQDNVAVPRNMPFNPSFTFDFSFSRPGSRVPEPVSGAQLIIDPKQDIAAGVYGESLDVQFQCAGGAGTELQPAVLQITVDVPSKLIASLAGGSASGSLDFNDFSEPTKTALVNVYSTGPYALSISSTNSQLMKLVNAPPAAAGGASSQIAYTLTFNGVPVSTAGAVHFPRTGVGGSQLPLSVTVESTAGKRAGTYHDTVTLTFTPLATL